MKLFTKSISVISGIVGSLLALIGCDNQTKSEEVKSVYGSPSYFGLEDDHQGKNSDDDSNQVDVVPSDDAKIIENNDEKSQENNSGF